MYAIRSYYDYTWPKPGEEAPQPKISFVQAFKPWGWIVGTGVYASDLNAAFWAHAVITSYSIHYTKLYDPGHVVVR